MTLDTLYFHDHMTSEEETGEEIRSFQRKFHNNGISLDEIRETDLPPFRGRQNYDMLLFDWGGAMLGNSCVGSFCREILREALDYPDRIYVIVSSMTVEAMKEALDEFKFANKELPHNVFLTIKEACDYIKKLYNNYPCVSN